MMTNECSTNHTISDHQFNNPCSDQNPANSPSLLPLSYHKHFTDDARTRNFYLGDLSSQLKARGYPFVESVPSVHRAELEDLLRNLQTLEGLATAAMLGFVWEVITHGFPVKLFSEAVMCVVDGELVFVVPYFPSPQDNPSTLIVAYHLQVQSWRYVPFSGRSPNPLLAFRRMPIVFYYQDALHMLYLDAPNTKFILNWINLECGEWQGSEFQLGADTPGPVTGEHLDGGLYGEHLYIFGNRILWQIKLATKTYIKVKCTGEIPPCSNGSSIIHRGHLYNFSKNGDALYFLNLKSFAWTHYPVANPPHMFNAHRHSHLIQLYEDSLLLIRACDGYRLHSFDLVKKEWTTLNTLGPRPCHTKTEASFTIWNNTLYALGGQLTQNHLHKLSLKNGRVSEDEETVQPERIKNEEIEKRAVLKAQRRENSKNKDLSTLFDDGFEDLVFTFEKAEPIKAHRAVVAASIPSLKERLRQMKPTATDSENWEIFISDVEPAIFEVFILHAYNLLNLAELDQDQVDLTQLFVASGKYQMEKLQLEIARHLFGKMDLAKSLPLFQLLCHEYCLNSIRDKFKPAVLKFVCNNLPSIIHTTEFAHFCQQHPLLVKEIMLVYANAHVGKLNFHANKKTKCFY